MTNPEAVILEHQQAVYNLARRMTGSGEAAREITQEAFLRLLGAMARGADPGPATRSYLYRTVLNLCADRWRRSRREVPTADESPAAAAAQPEWQAVRRELAADVRRAVLELPPAYRQVVVLRHYHGLAYEEIARVLGWPPSIVRNRLFRARQKLRESLEGVWKEAEPLAQGLSG